MNKCDMCVTSDSDCGCQRKVFQDLPGNENPQFLEDAKEIYISLAKKYPPVNVKNLDNILNALCASITILAVNNVEKNNHKNFIQLIYKILNKNL